MKLFLLSIIFAFSCLILSNNLFAQIPSPSPEVGAAAIGTLSGAVDKIPLSVPAWLLGVIAFLVEISMRFFPTVQPRSLFLLGAKAFELLGLGFTKISGLLDQIVQKLKTP